MKPIVLARSKGKIDIMGVFGRLRVLWVMMLAALLLSGCVKYDVGVNFESPHRGAIVQHIKLGQQLTSFSRLPAQAWLDSIERRALQLQGKAQRLSAQEIIVTIPFYTGGELESKFNQFFNPGVKKVSKSTTSQEVNLPKIKSQLSVSQNNFLLFVRNRLNYDLDLRSLGVLSSNGNVIVSPSSLLNLEFSLQTPLGARSLNTTGNALAPVVSEQGHKLVWTIKLGELNHLEAAFWLPSPLGIGALVIALMVLVGYYLKYKHLPGMDTDSMEAATL